MKDFTTLLERYLFDIIGIITPALVAVILYCLIIENCTLKTIINELEEIDYNTMVWSVIIVSLYVLGMIIKVIAIKKSNFFIRFIISRLFSIKMILYIKVTL